MAQSGSCKVRNIHHAQPIVAEDVKDTGLAFITNGPEEIKIVLYYCRTVGDSCAQVSHS
jgi:hypothetical protein